jgi:type I restriction enzyme, S subunit
VSDLPAGWRVVRLSDVVEINPPQPGRAISDDELISFVPMAAVEEQTGRLDPSANRAWCEVRTGYKRFQDGDVLFAKITPCMENGKVALADRLTGGVGAGSTEFHVLRPSQAVLPRYLMHHLLQEGLRREARGVMQGAAGQLRVPDSFLRNLSLPLPPRLEQNRIVSQVDSHLSRIDAAVAACLRGRANLNRYRASVVKAACEGRLVPTEAELARRDTRDYEPANVLLERVQKERRVQWEEQELEELTAKGKEPNGDRYKRKYKEPEAPNPSQLRDLPEGWAWATVHQLNQARRPVAYGVLQTVCRSFASEIWITEG